MVDPHDAMDWEGEDAGGAVFQAYRCRSLEEGTPHPGDIAEPASLAAIPLPPNDYPMDAFPPEVISSGKLSSLQLEGVRFACERHRHWLATGERQGFFLGDGAGVGKGRQIAGIILDNYVRGRVKSLWVSTSTDLYQDAVRDLRDLGAHIPVIQNVQALDRVTNTPTEGVLFMTYASLTSALRGRSRVQQVIEWLGGKAFEGALVLDECHKAKNFVAGKESLSTRVALCVLEIQRSMPRARVVYCSATGVSEVGNLAYMSRLGLWGPGASFPDFDAFLASMRRRGVTFMEMLAMELKGQGLYVSRGLSFRDAEFGELRCALRPEDVGRYDAAVRLWLETKRGLETAIILTGSSADPWRAYYGAVQRFFRLLLVSLKAPTAVRRAKQALAEGDAVIIGLQSTGESAQEALGLVPGTACGFISSCRQVAVQFVANHFPTLAPSDATVGQGDDATADVAPPSPANSRPAGSDPSHLTHASAGALRAALLERWRGADLPDNCLDVLIDQLGGPGAVAEMTGRKARICRDRAGAAPAYVARVAPRSSSGPDATMAALDGLNVLEREAFMSGAKLVAIVSDAASTGVSLHADRRASNRRRRLHLTIELPWSADKAIQQLGRSHRANQVAAPRYELVHADVGGEARFASAVARRLRSLGALTRGDRRAATGLDLGAHAELEGPIGRAALRRVLDAAAVGAPLPPPGVRLLAVLGRAPRGEALAELLGGDTALAARVRAQLDGGRQRPSTPRDVGGAVAEPRPFSAADLIAATRAVHSAVRAAADDMGLSLSGDRRDDAGSGGGVKKFLNRLLCLEVARQNLLFDYFQAALDAEIAAARTQGTYCEGVSDVPGRDVRRESAATPLWVDPQTGLRTLRHDLSVDRGLPFDAALAALRRALAAERAVAAEGGPPPFASFMVSCRPVQGRRAFVLATRRNPSAATPGTIAVARPGTGTAPLDLDADEVRAKYAPCSPEEARAGWVEAWERAATTCVHGPTCAAGAACQVGRRRLPLTVLSGSVIRVWDVLEAVLKRHEDQLSRAERVVRIVRVELDPGAPAIIGVRYPAALLSEVMAALSLQSDAGTSATAIDGVCSSALWSTNPPEPVTGLAPRCMGKAFRPPKTVLDFFKPRNASGAAASTKRSLELAGEMDGQRRERRNAGSGAEGGNMQRDATAIGEEEVIDLSDATEAGHGATPKPHTRGGAPAKHAGSEAPGAAIAAARGPPAVAKVCENSSLCGASAHAIKAVPLAASAPDPHAELVGMGFAERKAALALKVCRGDIQRAADWLLQTGT